MYPEDLRVRVERVKAAVERQYHRVAAARDKEVHLQTLSCMLATLAVLDQALRDELIVSDLFGAPAGLAELDIGEATPALPRVTVV